MDTMTQFSLWMKNYRQKPWYFPENIVTVKQLYRKKEKIPVVWQNFEVDVSAKLKTSCL